MTQRASPAPVRENYKAAACHPERRHAAKGLCYPCYSAQYPKAKRASCHPDRIAQAKGLCKSCYDRDLKARNPEYAAKQKQNSERWVESNYQRNLERVREHSKKDRVRHRDAHTNRERLLASFGLTWEDELAMLERQNGVCGICKGPPTRRFFDLDHDHETMKVRGLLCHRCNKGLGLLGDNRGAILRALDYLSATTITCTEVKEAA